MAAQQQQKNACPLTGSRQLKAIIFDVDGTLADTELRGHFVAYNHVFESLDIPWRWGEDEYRELLEITGGAERLRHYLHNQQASFAVPDDDRNAYALHLHGLKNQHYQQLVADNSVPLRPGIKRIINEARARGVRLAIATASHSDNVRALLEHSLGEDAISWFEVIAGGDNVKRKKPAPDIYQLVLKKLGLPKDNVVVVEDSAQGLQAALRAGLKTLVTTNYFTEHHDFTGALAIADHLGETDQPCTIRGDANNCQLIDLAALEAMLGTSLSEPALH